MRESAAVTFARCFWPGNGVPCSCGRAGLLAQSPPFLYDESVAQTKSPAGEYFVAGGTLSDGALSYVPRAADEALFAGLTAGKFCYVLNSRQMGKSSLCVRTMKRLQGEGTCTAFVDLTKIGGRNVTPEQWYAGIALEIGRALGVRDEILAYWKGNGHISPVQRLFGAIRDVVLEPLRSPVAVFFDEIDATRSLPFNADEFFAAIRECYNRRVHDPNYSRLTFCLLGVAVPSDLINSTTSTPFNVGERIYLRDFTLEEAQGLATGLVAGERQAGALLERIYFWSHGHPFLTQSLCQAVAGDISIRTPAGVDDLVRRDLLEPQARETNINLADVANRALHIADVEAEPNKFRADLLSMYEAAWKGKPVADDESNRVASLLKLSGIMRSEGKLLQVRNRIYHHVFDRAWIRENMPGQELRRQRRAFWIGAIRTGTIALLVLSVIGFLAYGNSKLAKHNAALAAEATKQAGEKEYEAYIADVNLMRSAYDGNDVLLVKELLDRTRTSPHRNLEWAFWNAAVHDAVKETGFPKGIGALVVSPDGGSVAVQDAAAGNGAIFSADDLHLISRIPLLSTQDVLAFAGGRFVLIDGANRHARPVRDAVSGKVLFTLRPEGSDGVEADYASPAGDVLACLVQGEKEFYPRKMLIWDARTGRLIHTIHTQARINVSSVSNGGKLVVLEEVDQRYPRVVENYFGARNLVVRDARNSAVVDRWQAPMATQGVTISPDGRFTAAALNDGNIIVRDVNLHKETRRVFEPLALSVSFSSDNSRLGVSSSDLDARIVDVKTGATITRGRGAVGVAMSLDGKKLLVSGNGTRLYLQNAARVHVRNVPHTWLRVEGFTPKGNIVAATGSALRTFDPTNLQQMSLTRLPVHQLSVSRDGAWLFMPTPDGGSAVTGTESRDVLCHVPVWNSSQYSGDVSRVHRWIATPGMNRDRIYAFGPNGRPLWTHPIQKDVPLCCNWSHNERFVAVGMQSGDVQILDGRSGQWIRTLVGAKQFINCTTFSNDDRLLATAGADIQVFIFTVATGACVVAHGHSASQDTAAFSGDGSRLLTSGEDGTARMWDTATGRQTLSISAGANFLYGAFFSPDEQALYTGDYGGNVTRYPLLKDAPPR